MPGAKSASMCPASALDSGAAAGAQHQGIVNLIGHGFYPDAISFFVFSITNENNKFEWPKAVNPVGISDKARYIDSLTDKIP